MHRNMDYAIKDSKDLITRLQALFKLDILVPEGVGKEVKANRACASLEKSAGVR